MLLAVMSDKKAGVCPPELTGLFYRVINGCCKISYKKRHGMAEVNE